MFAVSGDVSAVVDAELSTNNGDSLQCRAPSSEFYCNVEGQQSIEQGGLAVKMMLAEPIAWHLFATVFEQSEQSSGRRILASIA